MNDRDSAFDNIMRFMDDEESDDITNPLDHFTEEQIDKRIEKLDGLQAAFEHEITDYSLEKTKDIIQLEDEKDIYRVMIFSKGMNAYIVVFGSDAKMTASRESYSLGVESTYRYRCSFLCFFACGLTLMGM